MEENQETNYFIYFIYTDEVDNKDHDDHADTEHAGKEDHDVNDDHDETDHEHDSDYKGHRAFTDLRYGEEHSIIPSKLIFPATKS